MLYRAIHDLPGPDVAGLDAGPAAAAVAIERGERHLAMLARLADMAMDLTESLHRKAKESIESPAQEPDASPDPVVAFNKTAQTVRRIIALEARLAAAVKAGRDQMLADAAQLADAQDFAKTNAVIFGFHDAWAANCPKTQYDERVENLMEDAREHLRDVDEFRGYLDRPVGETVARLCEALDLDPGACEKDGDIWIVRRPPTEFETSLPLYKYPRSPVPPSPPGEGGSARSAETGGGWQPQSPDIYDAARAPP